MSKNASLRRLARTLLSWAVCIAPAEIAEWGTGMLAELESVEGSWAALGWAVSGAALLLRRAAVSWLRSNFVEQPASEDEGNAFQEASMRKAAIIVAASSLAVVFALAALPTFRQAVKTAVEPWARVFQKGPGPGEAERQTELTKLAKQAEEKHDAKAIAYLAVRLFDDRESARLAEEAVQLDASLTWVYGVVGAKNWKATTNGEWARRLEEWDPQNALPHLIAAELADIREVDSGKYGKLGKTPVPSEEWNEEMEKAFAAAKFDMYLSQREELARDVARRYGLKDPLTFFAGLANNGLPSYGFWDIRRYAESVVKRGEVSEATGDLKNAETDYWRVVRFGEVLRAQPESQLMPYLAAKIMLRPYERLRRLAEKQGRENEAAVLASIVDGLRGAGDGRSFSEQFRSPTLEIYRWNSSVVVISGLMICGFGAIAGLFLIGMILRRRSAWKQEAKYDLVLVGLVIGCAGLCMSSVTLVLSYLPYARAFDRFVAGDYRQTEQLISAYEGLNYLPGHLNDLYANGRLGFYAWCALTGVLAIGLAVMAIRMIAKHRVARLAT